MAKKFLFFIFILEHVLCSYGETAPSGVDGCRLPADDEIMLIDIPVFIGEKRFTEKAEMRAADAGREKPLGVVLSGGAARAMAHLGVLRRMEEEGIIPDFFVTNSMGSVIALLYSAGLSPEQIFEIMDVFLPETLFLPQIPLAGGLLDTSRFISVLYNILGEQRLENLKIPVAVITEDLITRRQIVFEEGDMYSVIRGSIAIPFNFSPEEYMGYLLMDGGCTNLVPSGIAFRYTDKVAVSSALYTKKQNLKNFITIINRMQDVSKTRAGIEDLKKYDSVWLRNPVEKYSFMGFDKSEEIIELGYDCASENIAALKELAAASLPGSGNAKEEFLKEREKLREKFYSYCAEYKKKKVVSLKEPAFLFTLGLSVTEGIPSDYYLNYYNYFYLGQEAGYKTMRFDLRECYFPGHEGIDSLFSFVAGDILRSKNRGLINFYDMDFDSLYYYSRNEIIYFSYDAAGIDPFFVLEGKLSDDLNETGSFHRFGLTGYAGKNRFITFSGFGFIENGATGGIGINSSFDQRLVGDLYFDQKTVFRIPMEENESIRLYKNDGVRGKFKKGNFRRILITNNTFYIVPDFSPSFAEAFIFKNCRIGLFGDFCFLDDCFFSSGVAFDFDISFIGLRSLKFLNYAGWDFYNHSFFAKFALGTEL